MADMQPGNEPSRPTQLIAYFRLFRLPNVFTAVADVTMGFFFVRQSLDPVAVWICVAAASSLIYTSGMVLNDVCDVHRDALERPFRPLPAGQISLGWARWLGVEMLLVGVALAWLSGWLYRHEVALVWRGGVVAVALAICVVLYDTLLKNTYLGPLAMGACRFLNVLLGMSIAKEVSVEGWGFGFDRAELIVAGGIGVYIVGVTCFARSEATHSPRMPLLLGIALMVAGMGLLLIFPAFGKGPERVDFKFPSVWPLLVCLLAIIILRRCLLAVWSPTPQHVQAAIKLCILSLIVLDAAVCLAVKPSEPYWSIGVLMLLIPTLLLGRWVYST